MKWWREFRKSKIGVVGLVLFIAIITIVILAPVLATHDPRQMTRELWLSPSMAHWLGTTGLGQDVFSQLLYAGRISLFIGIVTAIITNTIGTIVGLIAGYRGGWIDEALMLTSNVLMVLPMLPLLIILAQVLGPSIATIMIVLSVTGWTQTGRQIRAMALSLREYQYIESTKAIGAGNFHIIFKHILPNVFGVVISRFVMSVVHIILLETGLSFLGLGDPTQPSWGQMLHFAQSAGAFSNNAWWWWFPPGLSITILCASMAFIGMTFNDRFVLRLNRGGRA